MAAAEITGLLERALHDAGARVVREVSGVHELLPDHVLLSVDDSGIARWRHPGSAPAPERGGGKMIALGAKGVAEWEKHARPYRLRTFGPAAYERDVAPGEPEPWESLGDGRRALLFVHGTFGRAHEVFDLGEGTMNALSAAYEGRVFAFDHFTLTDDPVRNVERFLEGLGERSCFVDIVCHSRGGLVARQLAAVDPAKVRVDRIVFVGSPNDGTALAEPERFAQFVDVYTNLLTETPFAEALVGVVHLVSSLADDITDRLPGVVAQRPGSPMLARLRDSLPPPERAFGIASDFTNDGSRVSLVAADLVADGAFGEPNDLAVPVASVTEVSDVPFVPLEHRLTFAGDVHHFGYFRRKETRDSLVRWLASQRNAT
ncbi:MAG: esterase/lipase family protein [Polyangiales bacterium]